MPSQLQQVDSQHATGPKPSRPRTRSSSTATSSSSTSSTRTVLHEPTHRSLKSLTRSAPFLPPLARPVTEHTAPFPSRCTHGCRGCRVVGCLDLSHASSSDGDDDGDDSPPALPLPHPFPLLAHAFARTEYAVQHRLYFGSLVPVFAPVSPAEEAAARAAERRRWAAYELPLDVDVPVPCFLLDANGAVAATPEVPSSCSWGQYLDICVAARIATPLAVVDLILAEDATAPHYDPGDHQFRFFGANGHVGREALRIGDWRQHIEALLAERERCRREAHEVGLWLRRDAEARAEAEWLAEREAERVARARRQAEQEWFEWAERNVEAVKVVAAQRAAEARRAAEAQRAGGAQQ